jgi:hypothetical protein
VLGDGPSTETGVDTEDGAAVGAGFEGAVTGAEAEGIGCVVPRPGAVLEAARTLPEDDVSAGALGTAAGELGPGAAFVEGFCTATEVGSEEAVASFSCTGDEALVAPFSLHRSNPAEVDAHGAGLLVAGDTAAEAGIITEPLPGVAEETRRGVDLRIRRQ